MTELGAKQSQQAGKELRDILDASNKKRVHFVVSPLRRALQTAQGILSQIMDPTDDDDNDALVKVTVHPAAAEVLRDPCDIGSPVAQLETEFPNFDWELVRQHAAASQGVWWGRRQYDVAESWRRMREGLPDGVETDEQVEERLQTLRQYICNLSTADLVVVVCHSETIWYLSSLRGGDGDLYGIWTKNGEIVDLTQRILRPSEDPTEASSQSSSGESGGCDLDNRYQPFEVFLT